MEKMMAEMFQIVPEALSEHKNTKRFGGGGGGGGGHA